ncbi:MAG: PKD domain-containing protein [Flavisolibacter sp.]
MLFVLFVLIGSTVKAQLNAGFNTDRNGGCAPFSIFFTNTTSGASNSATYKWDFGNGNTSINKNPGAVYETQGTYKVTLTVQDGSLTSMFSKSIEVYKNPTTDFSVISASKGCLPLTVSFKSNSLAGSGSVVNYFWDFGDGTTQQGNDSTITHTYTEGQNVSAVLTATNTFGCSNTVIHSNLVVLYPGVKAAFQSDNTFLCHISDSVHFQNSSIGTGLTYKWDFGDGSSSSISSPSHNYQKAGAYSIKLTVSNQDGCTDSMVKPAYLNVANYHSDFSIPAPLCENSLVIFNNLSTPHATSSIWNLDGNSIPDLGMLQEYFSNAGKHSMKMINTFGNCIDSITKQFEIKSRPASNLFMVSIKDSCGAPSTVQFKDTTHGVVSWLWNFNTYGYPAQSTLQAPSYTYTQNGNYNVSLTVTNADGCSRDFGQDVFIGFQVSILVRDKNGFNSCDSIRKIYSAISTDSIISYLWHFSDNTTSTDSVVTHTFNKPGTYYVWLDYTTKKGCHGQAYLDGGNVTVYQKPVFDFNSLNGTTICGNTFVPFQRTGIDYTISDAWFFDGIFIGSSSYNVFNYQFQDSGKHTVSVISYNQGCRDTVTKVDYITVLPPFPKIVKFINTCDGDRSEVTFNQASKYAQSWSWDFGDGSHLSLTSDQPLVTHRYTKSGAYEVYLTVTNGQCTVKDSISASVLLKQKPVLSVVDTTICSTDNLNYTISGIDKLIYLNSEWPLMLDHWQYQDGTTFKYSTHNTYENGIYPVPFSDYLSYLQNGKNQLRLILSEPWYNCLDTSNYVPIHIKGAVAGLKVLNDSSCFSNPIQFIDTSKAFGTIIKSWLWNFGDGQQVTMPNGNPVTHQYSTPGAYFVNLSVTDTSTCTSASSYGYFIVVKGPEAHFTEASNTVPLNSTVNFYNNTNEYGSQGTTYVWQIDSVNYSTGYNFTHTFSQAGTYIVKLTATNLQTGCSSVYIQKLVVKDFNAAFSYHSSFITTQSCPPVLVQFNNTSTNYTSLNWDFGDGFTAGNVANPGHLYEKPGKYIVTLYVYGDNGLKEQFIDSVIVSETKASLNADVLHGCTSQQVTLTESSVGKNSYIWDFGDGNLLQGTDSFAQHNYSFAGVYTPHLLVKDSLGCTTSFDMGQKIIIDSLEVSLSALTPSICVPKQVFFNPTVNDVAANQGQSDLTYHWNFGTGLPEDTANTRNPIFLYQQPGTYAVQLNVSSAYGCSKQATGIIKAYQGLGSKIIGPDEICQQSEADFSAATLLPGQPKWQWIFDDGTTLQQDHASKTYFDAGTYLIKLVVTNNGCADTTVKSLVVHSKPTVTVSAHKLNLCQGTSAELTASGANAYLWSPATGLNLTNTATVATASLSDITYVVQAKNEYGCLNSDSVQVKVIHQFKMNVDSSIDLCIGSSVELKATGASNYVWIGNTVGLSNTQIANPMASPLASTIFTVEGTDAFHCFTDTANVVVEVHSLPTVDAGPNVELLAGTSYQMKSQASSDVIKWSWTPSAYLSCSDCSNPFVMPMEPEVYKLKVTNNYGCTATDTMSIILFCRESSVFVPNTFTPNGDGKNDRFSIKGTGIKLVKSFRIYNRWGNVVFEHNNFTIGDDKASWDGTYKGYKVSAGTYVYIAELSCNEKSFIQKGTITVVY